MMNSDNAPKEIVKTNIDLANMEKGLMDKNQQPYDQQELERLFLNTRGGARVGENRELHRVGAGQSSASTTTDTNTSFATLTTTKWTIDSCHFSSLFFHNLAAV